MTAQIREFSDRDLPTVVRLVNQAFSEAYQFFPYNEETFDARIREGKLTILVAEKEGEILGSVAYHDGHWGEEIEWLFVSEKQDRKIVENILIGEIEKYVKRGAVFTTVDAGSPKIKDWEERAYRLNNGLYHMVAQLDRERPLPMALKGVLMRCLRLNEEKEFVETVNAGFGWERVKIGDIDRWKAESPPFNEEWVQVAEVDKRIVSVVVAKPDTYFNRSFDGRRGYLGPATTISEHRNENFASALTLRAMNFLFERRMESVALYTAEQNIPSVTLLAKVGFEIMHHWRFMHKNLS
jgi:ribosomal protein S18 acetylase RimI-like enzyme